LRDVAWSDEKALNLFLFELEQQCVSSVKRHLGPPLERESECENFVKKHMDGLGTVSGPFIEDGRWVVMIRRKYTDVVVLLEEKLRDGGKNAGIAEGIARKLKKGFKVLANDEIVEVYEKNSEFARFLTEFLSGKPRWLEGVQTKN
jgi:tRNA nucleotidyltransferase (CCA-adding enzyme)